MIFSLQADWYRPMEEAFRSGTRGELIVTFLALLELMKLRTVTVKQQRSFAEIYICVREEEVHA